MYKDISDDEAKHPNYKHRIEHMLLADAGFFGLPEAWWMEKKLAVASAT